jgi:hypothetical protein
MADIEAVSEELSAGFLNEVLLDLFFPILTHLLPGHIYAHIMKTAVEIPDPLFHRA